MDILQSLCMTMRLLKTSVLFALLTFVWTSCQKDEVFVAEDVDIEEVSVRPAGTLVSYDLVSTKGVQQACDEALQLLSEQTGGLLEAVQVDSPSLLNTFGMIRLVIDIPEELEEVIDAVANIDTRLEVRTYRINYTSVAGSEGNEPATLSAYVAYMADKKDEIERRLEAVSLFHSGFNTSFDDVTAFSNFIVPIRSAYNNLVVYPFYSGVGADLGKHDVTPSEMLIKARQAIDAEVAALQLVQELDKVTMKCNYNTVNMGTSNGGGVSVATQYLLETDDEYKAINKEYVHLGSTYCCEGALNYANCFAPIMSEARSKDGFSLSGLTPESMKPSMYLSVVTSSYDTWKDVYFNENVTLEDFFKPEFLQTPAMQGGVQYANWIECFRTGTMEQSMGGYQFVMSDIVNEGILDADGQIDTGCEAVKCLFKCFDYTSSAISRGWTPTTPLVLASSMDDEFLPFEDILEAYTDLSHNGLNLNVKLRTVPILGHSLGVTWFFLKDILLKKYPCAII